VLIAETDKPGISTLKNRYGGGFRFALYVMPTTHDSVLSSAMTLQRMRSDGKCCWKNCRVALVMLRSLRRRAT
jgi:hypothetical protein